MTPASFLGLGWAATPAGPKAMEALSALEEERRKNTNVYPENRPTKRAGHLRKSKLAQAMPKGVASNEMCTFLILNISSLQLIPVNIIAYRSQYGSENPTVIVGAEILATAVSTGIAVAFCKIVDSKRRRA